MEKPTTVLVSPPQSKHKRANAETRLPQNLDCAMFPTCNVCEGVPSYSFLMAEIWLASESRIGSIRSCILYTIVDTRFPFAIAVARIHTLRTLLRVEWTHQYIPGDDGASELDWSGSESDVVA